MTRMSVDRQRTRRRGRTVGCGLLSLALALSLGGAALAQPAVPAPAARGGGEDNYTFAFQDADITLVAQEVLNQVGGPYTIDPAVTGKITFRIEQRLTRDQLLAALEAVLSANGVALVRNGDQLIVTPQTKAKSTAGVRQGAQGAGTAGYEVVAVPLGYAEPSEIGKALEAISPANTVLYTNDKLGLLLLAGSGQQLKSALETVKVFDQSAFQDSRIRWYELSQAQAMTVAEEVGRIIQGAGLVGVSVVPLKRLNGLIIFGRSTESLDEIGKWVTKLDVPGKEATSSLWVYRPRNTSAEALSRTLSGILGFQGAPEAAPTSTPTPSLSLSGSTPLRSTMPSSSSLPPPSVSSSPALGGAPFAAGDDQVRLGVDRDSNTLIIFAPPPRWVQIQRILSEIDRPPRQIFIEASILEVTLNKEFRLGVDWSVLSGDTEVTLANNNRGTVGPTFPGISITYLNTDIEAAVSALGTRTAVEVVSAPKIIALDNRQARLQVGDQVPVVVQSSQSTNSSDAALISTVDYRSTGVILSVTPRITGEDQVLLEVNQEVSSVARTNTSGIDSPTIQQRRFDSVLIVRNGGVVALGGLISTNRSAGNSGVPGLKDIPALGTLFRSQGRTSSRSELIVLLRAKILADATMTDQAMTNLLADMQELQGRGLLPASK